MTRPAAYDDFADVYEAWTRSVPVCDANRAFYLAECLGAAGPVAELGVGDGRIAVEVACGGQRVLGIDASAAMLARCRERARKAGVEGRITTIQADFRDFLLPEPVSLVTLPFHSIGHLLEAEERRACFSRAFGALVPGGRFVFDHFVFSPTHAERYGGVPTLRAEFFHPETGREALLWAMATYDVPRRRMRVFATSEELDGRGDVVRRRVRRLTITWIDPDETRALLEEVGFRIEALYGDFERTPFGDGAGHQVWVARRPD